MFGLVNGWALFLGGALLVASPIIIHLLSKRKYKVVDWAAIDFLMEADRRNRRRIRLENLLLLLLRCLVVILIALLVARPLFKSTAAAPLSGAAVDRIVLLDDSPSMGANVDSKTAFGHAVDGLKAFARDLRDQRPSDRFELRLTSKPHEPVIALEAIASNIDRVLSRLEGLAPSDVSASLDQALLAMERRFEEDTRSPNRSLYVISDMRQRDWIPASGTPADRDAAALLRRLRERFADLSVHCIDVGGDQAANLTITEVTPVDNVLAAGRQCRFNVTVQNWSDTDFSDVEVQFQVGSGVPVVSQIQRLLAGSSQSVAFPYVFREPGTPAITVSLPQDVLPADNVRHVAARVMPGNQVLIVDGDSNVDPELCESYYYQRALAPGGEMVTGNLLEVISDSQLTPDLPLQKYQTICLLNVYRTIDPKVVEALEAFVKAGGGLVMYLGDQADDNFYNSFLYKEGEDKLGAGLLPFKLTGTRTVERRDAPAALVVEQPNHPVFKWTEDQRATVFEGLKFYRWRTVEIAKAAVDKGEVTVLAAFADGTETHPAVVEKRFGQGRVLVFTSTADVAWNNWAEEPAGRGTYVINALQTIAHVSRRMPGEYALGVRQPWVFPLDVGQYDRTVQIRVPGQEDPVGIVAETSSDQQKAVVRFGERQGATDKAGFYEMVLRRLDGGPSESIRFGVNIDPGEGNLTRASPDDLKKRLGQAQVIYTRGKASLARGATGGGLELWQVVLLALIAALCVEQFLAWRFGRRR